jgi:hypothetical protein
MTSRVIRGRGQGGGGKDRGVAVADQSDVAQMQLVEELVHHPAVAVEGEVGAGGYGESVGTERKRGQDAAEVFLQALDNWVPDCSCHQNAVEEDNRRPIPVSVYSSNVVRCGGMASSSIPPALSRIGKIAERWPAKSIN